MTDQTNTAVATRPDNAVVVMGFGSLQSFEFMQRTARMFTQSSMVPVAYRAMVQKGYGDRVTYEENPAALANCIIALNMSTRMNADPLMIMQNLNIIEGRPSWSSQFIIASINSCGRFSPLRFEKVPGVEMDATHTTFDWVEKKKVANVTKVRVTNMTCVAWAVERGTEIPNFSREELLKHGSLYKCCKAAGVPLLESPAVSIEMAVNEGWYGKNGSKWQTMPDLMLTYRSSAFFGRIYAPELLMGLPAADELHDIIDVERQTDGTYAAPAAAPVTAPAAPVSKSEAAAAAQADAKAGVQDAVVKQEAAEPPARTTAAAAANPDTGEMPATITANQVKYLQTKINSVELPDTAVAAMLERVGAKSLETLTVDQFNIVKSELLTQAA